MTYTTLIDAKTLQSRIEAHGWRVFDCRCSPADPTVGRAQYLAGHIRGARHADLDRVLAARPTPTTGRHPLPERRELIAWLGAEGVNDTTQVVVYDDSGGAFAARLWWLLRWLGHEAVAVLDGGFGAWREVGGGLQAGEASTPEATEFPAHESLVTMLEAADVLAIVRGEKPGTLVDARAAARYRGEEEPIDPVAGHIPGALNRAFAGNLDERGRFRSPAELRERFAAVADKPEEAVSYCGSGVTACHNLLALEHAGLHGARLYAGSWSEWVRDADRPVARDDEE
jgi:thiosulfate/3-mercaptopyruvate sulfurtransferase